MTDLLTLAEARMAAGIGNLDTSKQLLFDAAISAASDKLEQVVGPVIYGTVTGELHDGGGNLIYLKRTPVAQIVTLVEYNDTTAGTLTAETNAAKPADGYVLGTITGQVFRRSSNADALFPVGRANVYCTYVAGRCGTVTAVPDRYKIATGLILKNLWRAWEHSAVQLGEFEVPQAQFPTFAIPRAVKDMLADEWRTGSGLGV